MIILKGDIYLMTLNSLGGSEILLRQNQLTFLFTDGISASFQNLSYLVIVSDIWKAHQSQSYSIHKEKMITYNVVCWILGS